MSNYPTPEEMGHVLLTPKTCPCKKDNDSRQCAVCEGGLAVCAICGEYEAGLDNPCTGKKAD